MSQFTFFVAGKPQGKARPRFIKATGRAYTPAKTQAYENIIRHEATKVVTGLTAPVRVNIRAVFPTPRNWSKIKTSRAIFGGEGVTTKPDIDNIAKAVLDGMNSKQKLNRATHHYEIVDWGVWQDDNQVVQLTVNKEYGQANQVGLHITVTELNND